MKRTLITACVLLLSACGTQAATTAAPTTTAAATTAPSPASSLATSSAAVSTAASSPTSSASSTAPAVNPADATTCRSFRNAVDAAGITDIDTLEASLAAADRTALHYADAVKKYQVAPASTGSASHHLATLVNDYNAAVADMSGGFENLTPAGVKAMHAKFAAVQKACTAISAWD